MKKYVIKSRVRSDAFYGSLLGEAYSVADVIEDLNEAITVTEWFEHLEGGEQLTLSLRSTERDRALNEVLALVQELGYSLLDAEVSEIVDKAVEGAVVGLFGGGALGSTTKSPALALVGGLAGALAGSKAGSMIETVGARHRYQWFPASGWIVTDVTIEARPEQMASAPVHFPA
jgi:hypothetical protein